MKNRSIVLSVIALLAMELGVLAQAQQPAAGAAPSATGSNASIFHDMGNNIRQQATDSAAEETALHELIPYIQFAATDENKFRVSLLSNLEQSRVDKQVGPGGNQNGSTNAVTRGSVPWLLGVAEEYGAVTQSTSGSTITFKLNPVNLIAVLNSPNYQASYTAGNSTPMVGFLRQLSFGFSFNTSSQSSGVTSSSTGNLTNSNAFTGFNAHYDIYNKRDSRDPKWDPNFKSVYSKYANLAGLDISNVMDVLNGSKSGTKTKAAYNQWIKDTEKAVKDEFNKQPKPSADEFATVLQARAEALKTIIAADPAAQTAVDQAAQAVLDFSGARSALIDNIMKSTIVSAEYNLINQANQPLVNTGTSTTVTTPGPIPNLSNIKIIVETPLFSVASKSSSSYNYAQLTANLSTTLFNSIPAGSHSGRVRDYQLSGQLDIPSGNLLNLGDATTTFSGVFLSLLQQPLGQMVQVNGVNINTKGNIGIFQAKLSIKVKNSGVQIPIAFTYATRTELVKESDVRGNVGVTFNLDSLFAGSQASKQ